MRKRVFAALAAAGAAALLVPAAAEAHGLVQRQQLPIPQWLFAWAAAAVLVISFFALAVLWPQPRLEKDNWRPINGGRAIVSLPAQIICGAIGVGLLVVTLLAGYIGSGTALDNWAPTFLLINFWVGMVFASIIFGPIYRAFSPFRAIGRLLPSLNRPYPEKLGRWPAVVCLWFFTWIELVSGWGDAPATLVTAALGYTILTLAAQCYWGVETWSRRGEAFAVYFDMFARMGIWEVRDGVARRAPAARRAAAARQGRRDGRVRHGDDRHGHVRRALPGAAVEEPVGRRRRRARRARDRGADRVEDRRDVRAAARRGAGGGLLPARDRGRAVGRRRDVLLAPGVRLHPHVRADRRRLRRRALPDVPRLRGPGDHLPGARTPSGRAGTSSARSTRGSTTRSSRRRTRGTCRSRWSWSATSRR